MQHHIKAGAGDWMDMTNHYLKNQKNTNSDQYVTYDIIIASETLYTIESCYETALLLYRHLKPITGRAYIATKRYYFGVGGGTDCFRTYCEELSLQATITSNNINNHDDEQGGPHIGRHGSRGHQQHFFGLIFITLLLKRRKVLFCSCL